MEALTPVIPIRPQLMTDLRNCVTGMIQSHEELATSQAKFQVIYVHLISQITNHQRYPSRT